MSGDFVRSWNILLSFECLPCWINLALASWRFASRISVSLDDEPLWCVSGTRWLDVCEASARTSSSLDDDGADEELQPLAGSSLENAVSLRVDLMRGGGLCWPQEQGRKRRKCENYTLPSKRRHEYVPFCGNHLTIPVWTKTSGMFLTAWPCCNYDWDTFI